MCLLLFGLFRFELQSSVMGTNNYNAIYFFKTKAQKVSFFLVFIFIFLVHAWIFELGVDFYKLERGVPSSLWLFLSPSPAQASPSGPIFPLGRNAPPPRTQTPRKQTRKKTTTRIPIGRRKKMRRMKFCVLLRRCRRNLTPWLVELAVVLRPFRFLCFQMFSPFQSIFSPQPTSTNLFWANNTKYECLKRRPSTSTLSNSNFLIFFIESGLVSLFPIIYDFHVQCNIHKGCEQNFLPENSWKFPKKIQDISYDDIGYKVVNLYTTRMSSNFQNNNIFFQHLENTHNH